jgi:hypothetical protein
LISGKLRKRKNLLEKENKFFARKILFEILLETALFVFLNFKKHKLFIHILNYHCYDLLMKMIKSRSPGKHDF